MFAILRCEPRLWAPLIAGLSAFFSHVIYPDYAISYWYVSIYRFHYENNLLDAVQPFDTRYEDKHGNRTIDAILHTKGITLFQVSKLLFISYFRIRVAWDIPQPLRVAFYVFLLTVNIM